MAVPPRFLISATTVSAAACAPPRPSTAPPRALTTTLAPRSARSSACARPSPAPAPVTIATRLSKRIVMRASAAEFGFCGSGQEENAWPRGDRRSLFKTRGRADQATLRLRDLTYLALCWPKVGAGRSILHGVRDSRNGVVTSGAAPSRAG